MTIDYAQWAAEERARAGRAAGRMVRPSLDLPAELVERIDRVAAVQGCTRHELVAWWLDHMLRSWAPTRAV
jgi:hypothetical protein